MNNFKVGCQGFIILEGFSTDPALHFAFCSSMDSLYVCFGMRAFLEGFSTKLTTVDLDTLIIVVDSHVVSKIC